MSEDKVIMDDIISLLPQEQQGIVKLAVSLSDALVSKEQAQKKSQSCITMLKNLLTYIAEETMRNAYGWKDFIIRYLKDPKFIESDSYDNISREYFHVVTKFNIPYALAMSSVQPVIEELIKRLKEDFPDFYAEAIGTIVVKDESESEEDSDEEDSELPF